MNQEKTFLLDRYKIIKTLEGGMGVVYLCVDEKNNNMPLALKTFKSPLIADNKIKELFLREATLWIEIGWHPNIVKAYNVDVQPETNEIFLGMELVPSFPGKDNASLRSWLTGLPLSLAWSLKITAGIARGMQFASEKIPGLVHRDLKPENILISVDEEPKITDFGLAKSILGVKESKNKAGFNSIQKTNNTAGTPLYMSSEQWLNKDIDHRSDIYAVGCILLEMLTGELAVHGSSIENLMRNHLAGAAIQKVKKCNMPKPLAHFLHKCLDTNVENRFNTWEELNAELGKICETLIGNSFQTPPLPIDVSLSEQIRNGLSFLAIANCFLDINDINNATTYFYKTLEIGKQQRHPTLLFLATSGIGIVHFNQGEYEKAMHYYQNANDLGSSFGADLLVANNYLNISNLYFAQGKTEKAKEYALKSISIAKDLDDIYFQAVLSCAFANSLSSSQDFVSALNQYSSALKIIAKTEGHVLEGGIYLGIGSTRFLMGQLDLAYEYYNKGLTSSLQKGNFGIQIMSLLGIAKVLLSQQKIQEALTYIEESKKIIDKISERNLVVQSYSDIGALLVAAGKTKEAMPYLTKAVQLSRELGLQAILARSYYSISASYEIEFDFLNAIKNLQKSADLFRILEMPEYDVIKQHLHDLVNLLNRN